jgi:hypothetical protein
MTTSTIKPTLAGGSIAVSAGSNSGILAAILKTLRMVGKAWEESRVEYKKRAILGGGWE